MQQKRKKKPDAKAVKAPAVAATPPAEAEQAKKEVPAKVAGHRRPSRWV